MTVGVALRLVVVMGLWAACFPLITLGLGLAPHLLFAALRAALAGLLLLRSEPFCVHNDSREAPARSVISHPKCSGGRIAEVLG